MAHFPGCSLEGGARAKESRAQRTKRERACDAVLTDSTYQDIWLQFPMGQQNKDGEAKKLYIQWQKLLPPNFACVVSTDEWDKVLWISEVSVILKCPHFLLGSAESVCDWGVSAILNPSSCSLLLPGALGTCAAHSQEEFCIGSLCDLLCTFFFFFSNPCKSRYRHTQCELQILTVVTLMPDF